MVYYTALRFKYNEDVRRWKNAKTDRVRHCRQHEGVGLLNDLGSSNIFCHF